MLIVSSERDASVPIKGVDRLSPSLTLREVFARAPILIKPMHVGFRRAGLLVEAPRAFEVLCNISPPRKQRGMQSGFVDLSARAISIGKGR